MCLRCAPVPVQMVVFNVCLSLLTCALYVADTYQRNADAVRADGDESETLRAFVTLDFAASVVFTVLFILRRCVGCAPACADCRSAP